jgi:hypothetical protein
MRALLALVVLASCASAGDGRTPADRVAGCWINRDVGVTTMRWLPDRTHEGVLIGSKLVYGQTGTNRATRYSLSQGDAAWGLCELDASGASRACWQVAQGQGGSLEGGRAFIDASGEALRIAVIGAGPEQVIFQGRRDGCD